MDYESMTVSELKELLKARGLKVGGKKAELVERLVEDDQSGPAPIDEKAPPQLRNPLTKTSNLMMRKGSRRSSMMTTGRTTKNTPPSKNPCWMKRQRPPSSSGKPNVHPCRNSEDKSGSGTSD